MVAKSRMFGSKHPAFAASVVAKSQEFQGLEASSPWWHFGGTGRVKDEILKKRKKRHIIIERK